MISREPRWLSWLPVGAREGGFPFSRLASESSKDAFEELEPPEQSLPFAVSSCDQSIVKEAGSVMKVFSTGLAVISSALAIASALYTDQPGTYDATDPKRNSKLYRA